MTLLGFPVSLAAKAGVAMLIAGLVAGVLLKQHGQIQALRVDLATEKQGRADDRTRYATAALQQGAAFRAEEQRRAAAQQEASDEAQRLSNRARAAADGARDAGQRLLDRAAAVAARCDRTAADPAPAGSSTPEAGAGLLAGVLSSAVGEARRYAAIADEARIAGAACERAYDALTVAPDATARTGLE